MWNDISTKEKAALRSDRKVNQGKAIKRVRD